MGKVPFNVPLDYFRQFKDMGDVSNAVSLREWSSDHDLMIYPYTEALPGALSFGCAARCNFCPSAAYYKGQVTRLDPEVVIPHMAGKNIHFVDEDFFDNDLEAILPLMKRHNVRWCAMGRYRKVKEALDRFGEVALADAGLVLVEIGLENVELMMKCDTPSIFDKVAAFEVNYLNMTFLPGETKATIKANAEWMKTRSLKRPIHFGNGLWYAPGQFFFPYGKPPTDGIMLDPPFHRVQPTFVPNSFLDEDFNVLDLEKANYYSQMVFDFKLYKDLRGGNVREFIQPYRFKGRNFTQWKLAQFLAVGLRCGAIV